MTSEQKTLGQELREIAVAEAAVLAGSTLTRGQKRLLGMEHLEYAELEVELERIRAELRACAQGSGNRVDATTQSLGSNLSSNSDSVVATNVETPHRVLPVRAKENLVPDAASIGELIVSLRYFMDSHQLQVWSHERLLENVSATITDVVWRVSQIETRLASDQLDSAYSDYPRTSFQHRASSTIQSFPSVLNRESGEFRRPLPLFRGTHMNFPATENHPTVGSDNKTMTRANSTSILASDLLTREAVRQAARLKPYKGSEDERTACQFLRLFESKYGLVTDETAKAEAFCAAID